MIRTITLSNKKIIGMAIAEIVTVPYYELYDKDLNKAHRLNHVFFSQIVSSLHKKSKLGQTSYEILLHSLPVANQTYKAQVKMFLIIREICDSIKDAEIRIHERIQSLKNDFEEKQFTIDIFDEVSEFDEFEKSMKVFRSQNILAIAKKEKAISNQMQGDVFLYYNPVITPSIDMNTAAITNAMTQNPESIVSMQIIPTTLTKQEMIAVEEHQRLLNYQVSNQKYSQGLKVDTNTQEMADAYDYYAEAMNDSVFYYNFTVHSQGNYGIDLANKLIDVIEDGEQITGSALEVIDITQSGVSLAENLTASPWLNSDILIYKSREIGFWDMLNAPRHFIRMRYLFNQKELRSIFKFPFDDGKTTGLDSQKVSNVRERLNHNIIAEDNFKLGDIQNTMGVSKNSQTQAGIPLNDFTKHGLIVGMPGSGKTNFSLGLLLQFWNDFNIPFLVVEPTKTEYRSLLDGISDLQVFTPGKGNVSPYIVNPFIPPTGVTVESYIPSLMTAFKAAFSMPNPLPDIFLAAVNDCYNEYGWRLNSTADDATAQRFGLYEFIKVFKKRIRNMDYKGDVKSNIESAGVVRLISLIEQNSNIYDTINSIPLEDLLRKPTVIELNAINNKEQKSLIMALLLIGICVYTKNNVMGDGKLKNVLLIDEAHVLLSGNGRKMEDSADSQGSTVEALEDMIAEIRSYGTSVIIADQSPTKVGRNVVANTNVKIIFKLVEKENKDAISTATNMSESEYEQLGRLGVGEAMLHYGRVYSPLQIRTFNVQDRVALREVIDDDEVRKHTAYWDKNMKLLIPHIECSYNCMCKERCDLQLRSYADFYAIRLINAYFYNIMNLDDFRKFLGYMDKPINDLLESEPGMQANLKLINCIKIKFLRKATLIKEFDISKSFYKAILSSKNFLRTGGELADE